MKQPLVYYEVLIVTCILAWSALFYLIGIYPKVFSIFTIFRKIYPIPLDCSWKVQTL